MDQVREALESEETKKLQKQIIERQIEDSIKHEKFLALIETTPNFKFTIPIKHNGKDKKLTFRRWNHEEATRIRTMPIYSKLVKNETLDEDEEKQWFIFKIDIVSEVIDEKSLYDDLVKEDNQYVDSMFNIVAFFSGVNDDFDKKLKDFMESDYGYLYGYLWLQIQGKTPSDVAKLPEMDVKFARAWLSKALEKMPKNVVS